MANSARPYLYVLLAVLFWSSIAAVGKLLLRSLDNFQIVLYATFFAALALFLVCLFQRKLVLLKKYSIKDYFILVSLGFVGIFLYRIFLYGAFMFAPAQEAFIINYLWPVMVVVFAILILREKITTKKIVAIILGFVGVYVVMTKGDIFSITFSHLQGDILAFLGACSWGLFSVWGKKYNYEKITSTFVYVLSGFVFALITTPIVSEFAVPSLGEIVGLAWIGIFATGLSTVLWFKALEIGDTSKIANIVFLTPFVSLVYIHFLVGEEILVSSVVGLIIIVAGILLQTRSKTEEMPA